MVETIRSAAVLLTLTLMGGVLAWAVAAAAPSIDMSRVLSLQVWQRSADAPASAPAVLGERDEIGARPVEVVEDYPAVRLTAPQSVFAPGT